MPLRPAVLGCWVGLCCLTALSLHYCQCTHGVGYAQCCVCSLFWPALAVKCAACWRLAGPAAPVCQSACISHLLDAQRLGQCEGQGLPAALAKARAALLLSVVCRSAHCIQAFLAGARVAKAGALTPSCGWRGIRRGAKARHYSCRREAGMRDAGSSPRCKWSLMQVVMPCGEPSARGRGRAAEMRERGEGLEGAR